MKNFKITYFALAIIAIICYGCPGEKKDSLSVSPDKLTFEANDTTTQTVKVTTDVKSWNVSPNNNWITVKQMEDGFDVTVDTYTVPDSARNGTISVNAGTADPVIVAVTQNAAKFIPYNTADGYYYGNWYKTGTADFEINMYNSSNENAGVNIEGFCPLPSSLANLNVVGYYSAASTGAALTFLPGQVDNSGNLGGTYVYDIDANKLILVTGGNIAIVFSNGKYAIAVKFTGKDYKTGATVTNLLYSYTGTISFSDQSGGGGSSGLAFTDIVKSNYTATGTPRWLTTPGPSSWTGQVIPSTGSTQYYTITNFGGYDIDVKCNFKSGQIIIDNSSIVTTDGATHDGYFQALAYDKSASTAYAIPDDYIVAYDKTNKILDFSGTYNGLPVYVGIIGKNRSTGKIEGIFTDLYENLKLKLTPVSQSSSSAPSMKAGAVSYSKFIKAESSKNFRTVNAPNAIQPLSKLSSESKRALLKKFINNHN